MRRAPAHAGSSLAQEAASKASKKQDDIPKSIAESVQRPMRALGEFSGVAEAMPEEIWLHPYGRKIRRPQLRRAVKPWPRAIRLLQRVRGKKPPDGAKGADTIRQKPRPNWSSIKGFVRLRERRAQPPGEGAWERVEGRYAGANTKLGISVVSVWLSPIITGNWLSTCE
jgi:hypothetical protein